MTTPADADPADRPWDDVELDLDAVGLAAEFGAYMRRHQVPRDQQDEAMGAWLDGMIADLERDVERDVSEERRHR